MTDQAKHVSQPKDYKLIVETDVQIEEIIPDTVNAMRNFGLKRIVPSAVGRQFVF